MEHSQEITKVADALCKAQGEMAPAPLDSKNPFHNSRYASLAAVMAVAHALNRHGIAITQDASVAEGRVCVTTLLVHGESGQWLRGTTSLKPEKDTPQGVGSAITYGRRYLLASMCGIVWEDDDDGNGAEKQPHPTGTKPAQKDATAPPLEKQPAPRVSKDFAAKIAALIEQLGLPPAGLAKRLDQLGVASIEELSAEAAETVLKGLEAALAKKTQG